MATRGPRSPAPSFALMLRATVVSAQQKRLTIGDIYDLDSEIKSGGWPAYGLTWISHLRTTMLEFILEHLEPGEQAGRRP